MTRRGPREPDEVKYCWNCGEQLVRKRFGSGKLESKDKFDARMYCDQLCYHEQSLRPLLTCPVCGEQFKGRAGHTNKYCSQKCSYIGQKEEVSTVQSTLNYRARVLKSHTPCEFCHSTTSIEVHHYDGNLSNNNLDNLISVCRGCHTKVHRRELFL